MTTHHPITPNHGLIHEWTMKSNSPDYELNIATQAARWGADIELEAWCSIALTALVCGTKQQRRNLVSQIREMRRPMTLQERALSVIDNAVINKQLSVGAAAIVRQALNVNN
jgi:hypothetical protein